MGPKIFLHQKLLNSYALPPRPFASHSYRLGLVRYVGLFSELAREDPLPTTVISLARVKLCLPQPREGRSKIRERNGLALEPRRLAVKRWRTRAKTEQKMM